MSQEVTKCPHCGVRIFHALAQGGKRMPFEADPSAQGRFVLIDGNAYPTASQAYRNLTPGERRQHLHYISHLAMCPITKRREGRQMDMFGGGKSYPTA